MTVTAIEAKARADLAMLNPVRYNQNSTTSFGLSGGVWRSDCSGFICAIAKISNGLSCPSTWELTDNHVTKLSDRSQAVPFRSVVMVVANDGFPFGHVALVIGYDAKTDRLTIQEHGGGMGPIRRQLPPGVMYDSVQKYGKYRNFQLYNVKEITGAVTPSPLPPVTNGKPTPWPFGPNDYIGPEEWGNESHGGFYPSERPLVAAVLRTAGSPNNSGHFHVADLTYTKRWQLDAIAKGRLKMNAANATGRVGPLTFAAMGL